MNILRFPFLLLCLFPLSILLWGCGYSRDEKARMKDIEVSGRENAVNYIEEKYGFTPEIIKIQVCRDLEDRDFFPLANGYVLVDMEHEGKRFQVHIGGEELKAQGRDDYQQDVIMKDAKEYFQALLGYEIYDIYVEYGRRQEADAFAPNCHTGNFIEEIYKPGDFEELLGRYPVNMRIDDCLAQDLTDFNERYPAAAEFFKEYTKDRGLRAILISYRSQEDYDKGYDHTYGRGGVLEFGIWNDGLYIDSFAAFEEEGIKEGRFGRLEYDGMIFSWIDSGGSHTTVSKGEHQWKDLGVADSQTTSEVYSVNRDQPGEITVYIPASRYGRRSVFIQHQYDGKWWQYEANGKLTEDKAYMFITYHGVGEGRFDFMFAP